MAWLGCYWAGLHPAFALLPIVPFFPHSERDLDGIARPDRGVHRAASHFESVFEYPVQVVAFLFGLVNAGVLLHGFGTGTWAVLTASLVGRPVGILVAVGVAVAAGLHVPRNIGWRELIVIALAASPSLAFGLFFAAAVFPEGPLLVETKMGAISTVAGMLLALAAARLLRCGRFASVAVPAGACPRAIDSEARVMSAASRCLRVREIGDRHVGSGGRISRGRIEGGSSSFSSAMLVETIAGLAGPWPLKIVIDYAVVGHHAAPAWAGPAARPVGGRRRENARGDGGGQHGPDRGTRRPRLVRRQLLHRERGAVGGERSPHCASTTTSSASRSTTTTRTRPECSSAR